MRGYVTTRHLFTHSLLIVRGFGIHCFARCVWRTFTAKRATTFLECL